jgi:hypothetical protein
MKITFAQMVLFCFTLVSANSAIALDSRPSGRDFSRMKSAIAMPLCVNWQNKSNSASTPLQPSTQPNHP